MYKLTDLDIILKKLKENNKLKEFILTVFNYKIESDIYEYHIQKFNSDLILYIYEKKEENCLYSIEFTLKESDVYMNKCYYKYACINIVYINKCIELYDKNIINTNIITFIKAMSLDKVEEQKELFSTILTKELIGIIYD